MLLRGSVGIVWQEREGTVSVIVEAKTGRPIFRIRTPTLRGSVAELPVLVKPKGRDPMS